MSLPTVAIVGRPNVGKSTLFNRLVGKRVALVDDRPGVTRDRREGEGQLLGLEFRVMDTAGFEDVDPASLPGRMRQQTEAAVREADVALFVFDGREGLTPLDEEIARWLRHENTPGDRRRQQVRRQRRRGRADGSVRARLRRAVRAVGRAWRGAGRPVRGAAPAYRARTGRGRGSAGQGTARRRRGVCRPAQAGDRRAAQRRQVDPGQQDARRGPHDHRPRGRDHARFDQHRLAVDRQGRRDPPGAADRHRRPAQARQGRRQARAAVGARYQARDRFRRSRRAAARRDARARGAGFAHRRPGARGRPRPGHRAQQMGRRRTCLVAVQRGQGGAARRASAN